MPCAILGSRASLNASPMNTNKDKSSDKTTKAEIPNQGACILALPWANNSPKLGLPAGSPKPKKSKEVSVVILHDKINGIKVRVAISALGKICFFIILKSL